MSDGDLSSWHHDVNCPLESTVWFRAIQDGHVEVVVEVHHGVSPPVVASLLGHQMRTKPIVLDRYIRTTADFSDLLTVLLPMTEWKPFLLRATNQTPRGVKPAPWSHDDSERKSWLQAMVELAHNHDRTSSGFEELMQLCGRHALSNERPTVSAVSVNRPVEQV